MTALNTSSTDPLAYNFPIVDKKTGAPTPEFIQKWERMRRFLPNVPGLLQPGNVLGNAGALPGIGTSTTLTALFDFVYGKSRGQFIYRGANVWQSLAASTAWFVLTTQSTGADPAWHTLSDVIDNLIGNTQGDTLYRGASAWAALAPGLVNQVLTSGGAAANPSWSSLSALLDAVFGSTQGSILYRGASAWAALGPGTAGQFLKTQGAGANPVWAASGGGGSGYPKGTPPTVVQVASSSAGGNSVTFSSAPTNGNLLVAASCSPTASSAGAGWTLLESESSGTDFGLWLWKKAGAGESTTQTPLAGGGANGALMVWELNGQAATTPIVCATAGHTTGTTTQSGFTGSNTWSQAHIPMDTNCIGLAMTVVVASTSVIRQYKNFGTADMTTLSGGTRQFVAGHTDWSQTPTVGIALTWDTANSDCKSLAAVVTA